jgi:hypothetical protein
MTLPPKKKVYTNFKWALKKKKPKLFSPIASNKNRQKFTKNLEVMIRATKPNSQDRLPT